VKFNNRPNRCIRFEGEELWISRSVTVLTVLVVLIEDHQAYVPLNQRGPALPVEVGKWGLSGGYLDYDETAGDAVIRETWEELGLNLLDLKAQHRLVGSLEQPTYVHSEPRRQQNVTLRFPLLLFLSPGTVLPHLQPQVDQSEVAAVWWAPLAEALTMPLAFNHQEILRHCLENEFKPHWPECSLVGKG
jgi:8-oxo-dGTP diphosphatase